MCLKDCRDPPTMEISIDANKQGTGPSGLSPLLQQFPPLISCCNSECRNYKQQKSPRMSSTTGLHAHPYYPTDAAIPGYAPNERDTLTLVSIFATVCTGVSLAASLAAKRARPQIPASDLWTIVWFALCTTLHLHQPNMATANRPIQAAASTSSSKATSHTTSNASAAGRTSSASSGRNTRSPTRGI